MSDQSPEKICIDGFIYDLHSEPLYPYIERCGITLGDERRSSMLLRGYVGTWMVDRNRLYLVDLEGYLPNGTHVTVETFFPEHIPGWWHDVRSQQVKTLGEPERIHFTGLPEPNERVFARWYSGMLMINQGKVLTRNGIGHGGRFEKLLQLSVESGIVVSEETHEPGSFL